MYDRRRGRGNQRRKGRRRRRKRGRNWKKGVREGRMREEREKGEGECEMILKSESSGEGDKLPRSACSEAKHLGS